jgi:hypothetical protein
MSRFLCIALVLLVIAISGVPLLSVAKWTGYFTLTVDLNVASDIDGSSITYVEGWNDDVAHWLANDRSRYVAGFELPDRTTPNSHAVTITCSGNSGGYGLLDTYHQPAFFVVQYRNLDAEEADYAHKLFVIPQGPGPRSTNLTLL